MADKNGKKTGGRQKGVKNKRNLRMDKALFSVGWDFAAEFKKLYDRGDNREQHQLMRFIAPYVAPKMAEIEVNVREDEAEQHEGSISNIDDKKFLKLLKKA